MAPQPMRGVPLLAGLLALGASWPGLVRAEEPAGLYRTPIYVGASSGIWKVEEGRVRFLSASPPPTR